jgi:hypothetical protein
MLTLQALLDIVDVTPSSRVGWVAAFWQPNINPESHQHRVFVGLAYRQPNLHR